MLPFLLHSNIQLDTVWLERLVVSFGMQDIIYQPIESMSGGQRERVLLILSVIHKPDIWILDEPGTSLDSTLLTSFCDILTHYAAHHICILTSHQKELQSLANHTIFMHDTLKTISTP
jgi:ABC-type multidrug transport system ATPase subunit